MLTKTTKSKVVRKGYYELIITSHEGKTYFQDLQLSELHLLATITKENDAVTIRRAYTSKEGYKQKFNV